MKFFVLIATLALTGCVLPSKTMYLYSDKDRPLPDVALIHAIPEAQKHNLNPLDSKFAARIEGVSTHTQSGQLEYTALSKGGAPDRVYVAPGTYTVKVMCSGGGFNQWFATPPVTLRAGQEYVIECHGTVAANVQMRTLVQPMTPDASRNP
jgi:hypothetical protein